MGYKRRRRFADSTCVSPGAQPEEGGHLGYLPPIKNPKHCIAILTYAELKFYIVIIFKKSLI